MRFELTTAHERSHALSMSRKRILFMAESITLAQIVRLRVLAGALDPMRYEVHFASGHFPQLAFSDTQFERHELTVLDPKRAANAVAAGRRLYDSKALERYVRADLDLIERLRPEIVVGDFRLSLSTSAELAGVHCAVLINAYWSPFARDQTVPVPDHPVIGLLGERLTERYFPKALPRAFEHFAAPVNEVRRRFGLEPIGSLRQVLTHATTTLYPDHPGLTPLDAAPTNHVFLGPVLWAPNLPMPELRFEHAGRPLVYVTLGSSGRIDVLDKVVRALGGLQINAVVATAGRISVRSLPSNVAVADFVPGNELARRASVVITNGGSTTGYQALAEGTVVLGLPSNLDQFLASRAITAAGGGVEVKARTLTQTALTGALERCLRDTELRAAAQRIGHSFDEYDSSARFENWLQATCG